jgi:phage protein D
MYSRELATDLQPKVLIVINGNEIPSHQYLVSLEVKKDGAGYEGSIELYDPDWTVVESIILEKGVDTVFDITYGWDKDTSTQFSARLINYEPTFSEDGVHLNIEFLPGDRIPLREKNSVVWSSDLRISEIITTIAAKNGWGLNIEPTLGTFSKPFIQNNVSDMYFIQKSLMPFAKNVHGNGGFQLNVQNNVLSFHTSGFRQESIYKTYYIQRGRINEVKSFSVSENTADVAQCGGNKVTAVGFDPVEKKSIKGVASYKIPSGMTLDGTKIPSVIPFERPQADLCVIHRPFHSQSEAEDFAKIRYTTYSQYNFNATMDIMGDPNVPLFALIEIIILTPSGIMHYLSGVYTVQSITDKIGAGDYTTSLELNRNATSKGSLEVEGVPQTYNEERTDPSETKRVAEQE